jgi:hypothetical protein
LSLTRVIDIPILPHHHILQELLAVDVESGTYYVKEAVVTTIVGATLGPLDQFHGGIVKGAEWDTK